MAAAIKTGAVRTDFKDGQRILDPRWLALALGSLE
jgi:hypothetical protein